MKRTNLKTWTHGKERNIYTEAGNLYFRFANKYHLTYRYYCYEDGNTEDMERAFSEQNKWK